MGRTLTNLSKKTFKTSPVFRNRFVIEVCEKVHTHYKNLRIVHDLANWESMAEGFRDALARWKARGEPQPDAKNHIELCRKFVSDDSEQSTVMVNLNQNLYLANKGTVFAEGAEIDDAEYIHLKIGDLRLELTLEQFGVVAEAIKEADAKLKKNSLCTSVR